MLTYLAIADRYRPTWLVWENVPGVLSSNGGRDFGTFLGGLGQLGYGFAYRILDAQYFGVAQRRRRVFVVGHLGDWRRAAAVLFERYSLQGHPAPQRKAGQGFAVDAVPSLTASGRGTSRTGESRGNDPVIACAGIGADTYNGSITSNVAATLGTQSGDGMSSGPSVLVPDIVSQAMSAKWAKGTAGPAGDEHHNLIAVPDVTHSLRGEGFDASEDGTGRGTPLIPVAYRTAGDGNVYEEGPVTAPLTTGTDQSANIIAFDTTQITSAANRSNPQPGDPCHPLAAGAHAPAIAFSSKDYGNDAQVDLAPTLRSMAHDKSHMNGGGQFAVAQGLRVRRLTPRECERLQGFPDDYTAVAKLSDSARYKALGNSWAVPCARWIGERINLANQIPTEHSEAA